MDYISRAATAAAPPFEASKPPSGSRNAEFDKDLWCNLRSTCATIAIQAGYTIWSLRAIEALVGQHARFKACAEAGDGNRAKRGGEGTMDKVYLNPSPKQQKL